MTKRLRFLFGSAAFAACLFAFLAGCGPSEPEQTTAAPTPGVTSDRILIGSSLALSGHAKYLGIQTLSGAMCYINHVNDQGGVFGRRIEVKVYDDAYDPSKCLVNTQKLIVEDQVFALFSYVGTPTTVKILPLVEQAKIPLLGMFTGANALRDPFNPFVMNVRASYYQETRAAVDHLVEDLGLTEIAVFYQYDAYGFDGLTGTELALKKHGLAPVARGTYIRGTMDIDDGLERIMASGAQAVVMIGTYDPCAKFIRTARARGFDPVFYNVSFVGGEELARRLADERGATVILSQVVPAPTSLGNRDDGYIELLARYYPDDKPSFIGLEGYFNARVLVEGLRRAGPDLTRQGFVEAVESLESFEVAEHLNVSFSPLDHQGMDKVYFTRFDKGRFRMIRDWSEVAAELDTGERQ